MIIKIFVEFLKFKCSKYYFEFVKNICFGHSSLYVYFDFDNDKPQAVL